MSANEIRVLSIDETDAVSGGMGFLQAAGEFLHTLFNGPDHPGPTIDGGGGTPEVPGMKVRGTSRDTVYGQKK